MAWESTPISWDKLPTNTGYGGYGVVRGRVSLEGHLWNTALAEGVFPFPKQASLSMATWEAAWDYLDSGLVQQSSGATKLSMSL